MTSEFVRFFILLAVFASIFLIGQAILRVTVDKTARSRAVNKRLELIAKGVEREDVVSYLRKNHPASGGYGDGMIGKAIGSFRRNLMMAGVPLDVNRSLILMGLLFAIIVLLLFALAWSWNIPIGLGSVQIVLAFAGAAAVGLPTFVMSFLAQRRRKKMQAQFPVALDIFVRALRSGHPVASAIRLLTEEMDDPIGSEFGLISDEVSYGADLTAALSAMAGRWDLDDIRMFVVSLAVQSETGGNLAEILNNLSSVIRERASLYLKVRALSSEGRMTGWLLSVLPVIAFVLLFTTNPAFYLDVATDPVFYIGFPLLVGWYFVGVFAIRRLIDLKV